MKPIARGKKIHHMHVYIIPYTIPVVTRHTTQPIHNLSHTNTPYTRYLLRAASSQARGKWVRFLEDEISGAPPTKEGDDTGDGGGDSDGEDVVLPPPSPGNSGVGNRRGRPPLDESDMTPAQRKRFAFFRQMRIFVANLTYICER